MIRDRQLDILRAIVTHYVQTREPVSSKAVASSCQLGVSSATVRNDMSTLESEGLIFQPHTSAGRVPTEAGYRLFVDRLTGIRPLTNPQQQAIEQFLGQAVDFEDVVARTVRSLAQLTRTAAVVKYPSIASSTLRRVEVVDLSAKRLLVVVVASSGQVEERLLELEVDVSEGLVVQMRDLFNAQLEGHTGPYVAEQSDLIESDFDPADRPVARRVLEAVVDLLGSHAQSRMIVVGLSYLARAEQDFEDVSVVLDTLEEQVALLRLLSEVHTDPLQVSIGTENLTEPLEQAAVVSATYRGAGDGSGQVGVVGPTRMDYPHSLVAVEAVSRYLSHLLAD